MGCLTTGISIEVCDAVTGSIVPYELPYTETEFLMEFRPVPGSNALEILLAEEGAPVLLAEIDASDGQPVRVRFDRTNGQWQVSAGSRTTLRLPPVRPRRPSALAPPSADAPVDIAFLVDATCRIHAPENRLQQWQALLQHPVLPAWQAIAHELDLVACGLAEGSAELRTAVLAFGDEAVPSAVDTSLKPQFTVFPRQPESRCFRVYEPGALEREVLELPASSGGDVVDALAEGLEACANLPWRDSARKVVIVYGDSPGHSVLEPAPPLADALARRCNVDAQREACFRLGLEVITVWHRHHDPRDYGAQAQEYLEFTQRQYRRLASLRPDYCFQSPLDGSRIATAIRGRSTPIAFGSWPGILLGNGA